MPDFLVAGEILGAMITPAVLISASGTLVLSTSNRLARVVDRIRGLAKEAEELPDESNDEMVIDKRHLIANQLTWHSTRLGLLQATLIILYLAIGLLVGASFTVGLSASAKWALSWVPVSLGLLGASFLMLGATLLVREARLAVRGTRHELDHIRRVVSRKTTLRLVLNGNPESDKPEG